MLAALLHTGFSLDQNWRTTLRLCLTMLALVYMDSAVLSCTCTTALSQSSMTLFSGSSYPLDVYWHFSSVFAARCLKSAMSDLIHLFARHVAVMVLCNVFNQKVKNIFGTN